MKNDHNFYVQLINDYILETYPQNKFYWESDLKVHSNVPKIPIANPTKIGERLLKIPDLVAVDQFDPSFTILGEAKTFYDYLKDSQRVSEQLDYYFNRLKYKKKGLLICALPHALKVQASNLINRKRNQWDVSQIKYVVLTDLEYAINILKN